MRVREMLLAAVFLVTALLVQRSVLASFRFPGTTPDLLVVVVVGFAVRRGPAVGASVGFAAGLLADMAPPSDHAVGRLALVFTLAGYLAGLARDEAERSALIPVAVVAFAAAFVVLADAGMGRLFGDERITLSAVGHAVPAAVLYDVVLAPFVVPVIAALERRLEPEAGRR